MNFQQYKRSVVAAPMLLLLFVGPARAVDKPPAELQPLIPAGTTLLTYSSEDMNGDGRKDFVFVVEKQANPTKKEDDEEGERTLFIAIRQADNQLKIVKHSKRAVLCRQCGGSFGDPFDNLEAKPKTFSISHFGGSAWRWSYIYTFAYSRRDDSWQLVQVYESTFHATEPDKAKSKTYKPPKHFGKIDIADFDPDNFKGVGPK